MRRGLFALGLLCAAARCAGEGAVRGVPPDERAQYVSADGKFACRDGKGTIPFERVNDDYCDCRDGSDEPGTSACSAGRFHCANAGYFSTFVFASRVRDGICDCCDGSDEAGSAYTTCENRCAALAARDLIDFQARADALRAALIQTDAAVEAAQKVAMSEREELRRLEGEGAELDHRLANVTARVNALEEEERKKREAEEAAREEERKAREAEEAANAPPPAAEDEPQAGGEAEAEGEAADFVARAEEAAAAAEAEAIGEAPPASASESVPAEATSSDGVGEHAIERGEAAAADGGDAGAGAAGGGGGSSGGAWMQSWMRMDEPPPKPAPTAEPQPGAPAGTEPEQEGASGAGSGGHDEEEVGDDEEPPYPDDYAGHASGDEDEDEEYDHNDYGGGDDAPHDYESDYDGDYGGDSHDYGDDDYHSERDDDWAGEDETAPPGSAVRSALGSALEAARQLGGSLLARAGSLAERMVGSSALESAVQLCSELLGVVGSHIEGAVGRLADRLAPTLYHRFRVWAMRSAGIPLGELQELREERRLLGEKKRKLDDRARELRKGANLDVGPNGRFRALSRKCFKYAAPDYTYEFCPFDHVSQKKDGVEVAALGTWKEDSWLDGGFKQMRYKDGLRCWNGPARSTTVTLECGPRAEITSVSEPEMCSYALTFVTPAACSYDDLQKLESSIATLRNAAPSKDEL